VTHEIIPGGAAVSTIGRWKTDNHHTRSTLASGYTESARRAIHAATTATTTEARAAAATPAFHVHGGPARTGAIGAQAA